MNEFSKSFCACAITYITASQCVAMEYAKGWSDMAADRESTRIHGSDGAPRPPPLQPIVWTARFVESAPLRTSIPVN